jgi:hypothetical protein
MSFSYVSFEPIDWVQEVRDYQSIGEGRYLIANCRAAANCHLLLDGKTNLRDFALIPISIRGGQPTAESLARLSSQKALGGIFYDQDVLYGWFSLRDLDWYTALWDQVLHGDYSGCSISLGVRPVEGSGYEDWTWDTNQPLSVETVSIQFTRKAKKPSDETTRRVGLFGLRLAKS